MADTTKIYENIFIKKNAAGDREYIKVPYAILADPPTIPDVSGFMPKSGGTFTGNISVPKTITFTDTTNPFIKMTTGGTDFYFQSTSGQFGLGPTWNKATHWDSNGNVTFPTTPKVGSSSLALKSDIPADYVKYTAQTLTDAQKSQARSNIGAGTSNFSGNYNGLSNKPTIPAAANNGTLTIQKNGTNVATFGANQSTNATANITVPTKTSQLTNDSNFVKSNSGAFTGNLTADNFNSRFSLQSVPYGTAVGENADLNTVTYLSVGNYYCGADAIVSTMTNVPVKRAFMMTVYSPLTPTVDNEPTGKWVYRVRKFMTYLGEEYIQSVYSGNTAGTFTYNNWQQIAHKSDIPSVPTITLNGTTTTSPNFWASESGSNIAIGDMAAATGANGVAIGYNSSVAASSGVAIGIVSKVTGAEGIAIGGNSSVVTARGSIAIGFGSSAELASYSIAIGPRAEAHCAESISIGYEADGPSSAASTYIGTGGYSSSGRALYLGAGRRGFTYMNAAGSSWTSASDIRDKTDIEEIDHALDFIKKLKPITYVMNEREKYLVRDENGNPILDENGKQQYDVEAHKRGAKKKHRRFAGLSAQDTYQAMLDCYDNNDNYAQIVDNNKFDHPDDEYIEQYCMSYERLVPFLIKAMQEQQAQIEKLKSKLGE